MRLLKKENLFSTQSGYPAPHFQHSHIGYNHRLSNGAGRDWQGTNKCVGRAGEST